MTGPPFVPIDPEDLFRALSEAELDYILIGGLATAAHGVIRATKDMDICPDPDLENLRRLADLLTNLDAELFDAGDFEQDELVQPDLRGLAGGGNFCLMTRLGRLDVMQHVEPFGDDTWKALDRNADERAVFGQALRVCSYEDLVEMKMATGRHQDLIDIKSLKAARGEADL